MSKFFLFYIYFLDEPITDNCEIEEDKSLDQIRKEPYSLPSGFYWSSVDLDNSHQVSRFIRLDKNHWYPKGVFELFTIQTIVYLIAITGPHTT
ncbi:unnamed protein product [Protopolystoma xenopodis]|uniref:glycylpeptide N-tetradecanoyltransferase n=1 Tax=Protopolystoma xenopodis TaxID=117903 RepID=A0A3S5CK01_9PLAT|nr:unnamed protein product [Protopolystoma xenopodis]